MMAEEDGLSNIYSESCSDCIFKKTSYCIPLEEWLRKYISIEYHDIYEFDRKMADNLNPIQRCSDYEVGF